MIFGSHLYGTDTPESDTDYKGIFLPTKDEILLGKIPRHFGETTGNDKSKNTKEDTDIELFSLHEFIKLACEGQTVALDMLHAPVDKWIDSTMIWTEIVDNREKFYTKNLKAFVGYARRQAAKYGIKGSRLDAAKDVLDIFEPIKDPTLGYRVEDVWEDLPINEHCHMMEDSPNGVKQYHVCGRALQSRETISHAYGTVEKFYSSYGARAKQASNNMGIDWKAVSHAVRAAYQVEELLTEGTITFPLRNSNYIKQIKCGELDYRSEVGPHLDEIMEHVGELSKISTLPAKSDRKFWDNFIKETMESYVL